MYHEELFANAQQLTLFCLAPVLSCTLQETAKLRKTSKKTWTYAGTQTSREFGGINAHACSYQGVGPSGGAHVRFGTKASSRRRSLPQLFRPRRRPALHLIAPWSSTPKWTLPPTPPPLPRYKRSSRFGSRWRRRWPTGADASNRPRRRPTT